MLVRIEEVDRLPYAPRRRLGSWSLHIADLVEAVAVGNTSIANTLERSVELAARHGEGQMLTPLRSPRGKLYDEIRADPDDGEGWPITIMGKSHDIDIEGDGPRQIIDRQNEVVELNGHRRLSVLVVYRPSITPDLDQRGKCPAGAADIVLGDAGE